jgi:Family of unknown function (DUF6527)
MSAVGTKLRRLEGGRVAFWCPACNRGHALTMRSATGDGWGWNDDADVPTFTPSVLTKYNRSDAGQNGPPPAVCHLYVTNGRLLYLGDCTHAMAGKTVDMPDWPGAA